jgi:hypothetical protein
MQTAAPPNHLHFSDRAQKDSSKGDRFPQTLEIGFGE